MIGKAEGIKICKHGTYQKQAPKQLGSVFLEL